MNTEQIDSRLVSSVLSTLLESLPSLLAAHEGERLVGLALCTDDGLRTLYAVACTDSFCQAHGDETVLFMPVEWAYPVGGSDGLMPAQSIMAR